MPSNPEARPPRGGRSFSFAAAALMYAAPIGAMSVWAIFRDAPRSVAAILLTGVLVAVVCAAITRTWRRFYLAQFPLYLLSLAFVGYAFAFKMPPGRTLAHIVDGASWEEIRGFAGLSQWTWYAVLLIPWAGCYQAFAWRLARRRIFDGSAGRFRRPAALLLVVTCAYVAFDPGQLIDGIALEPMVGSLMFLAGDIPHVKSELRGSFVHKIPYHAVRRGDEEVHILVVGESVRRESWSAYGYGRATTPFLNGLGREAIFLQDAVADANLTQWSVPIMLTGMSPVGFDANNITGNLLDLAKEAGYSTAWLVNQDIAISTSIGITADRLDYPADFEVNINGRHTLDEVLLPGFQREIERTGAARFIGIHMMGSHWEYYRRYPAAFRRFSSADAALSMVSVLLDDKGAQAAVVDSYDNATLYTDWFLKQLIERARTLDVPATLTFFPDHGEDLQLFDGEVGHGQPNYTRHAFEIPAFVWANDAYRRRHPEIVAALERNASEEIRTHNVFYAMADLMGIQWPGAVEERSFASARFVPDRAMQDVAGGVLVSRR